MPSIDEVDLVMKSNFVHKNDFFDFSKISEQGKKRITDIYNENQEDDYTHLIDFDTVKKKIRKLVQIDEFKKLDKN